jgi:hypothetical protein
MKFRKDGDVYLLGEKVAAIKVRVHYSSYGKMLHCLKLKMDSTPSSACIFDQSLRQLTSLFDGNINPVFEFQTVTSLFDAIVVPVVELPLQLSQVLRITIVTKRLTWPSLCVQYIHSGGKRPASSNRCTTRIVRRTG